MPNPAFVFEPIETTPRTRLFTLLGIPVYRTPYAWLNPLIIYPPMLALAFLFFPAAEIAARLGQAVILTFLAVLTLFVHSVGHILSGKLAGAPMDGLLLTATRQVNLYEGEQDQFSPRVHILRALGGPVANILAGSLGLLLLALVGQSPALVAWALFNLGAGIGALAPIESVDGGTLVRYLRQR